MDIQQLKKIKQVKFQYEKRIRNLQEEIFNSQNNIDREEIMNKYFEQKWWEIELDIIFNYDKEIVKLCFKRIQELKLEKKNIIKKIIEA